LLLCVIALAFARWKGIPNWAALPSLAAFLVVYPFYLAPAFPSVREQLAGAGLPGFLVASAVLPYLACCAGAIPFQLVSFVKLIALALALGLWYRVLPAVPMVDVGFLVLILAVKLGRYGAPIYPTPFKGVEIGILSDLALFNMAVLVLMLERRIRETGFGFLPTASDWRIGARNYLYFLPIGAALGFLLKAGRLVAPSDPLRLAGYFIGFLFVLTLAEEFLFRGVLQQWIEDWTWSRRTALILTSILFGGVHLWFRHFPNWQWVILAGTLGWFCGRARNQAGSIRAAMVTHTLVITTWRAFFA
jgi:membrane protease YdiL (CAAX protease family)